MENSIEGVCSALDIGEGISSAVAKKGPAELDDQKENVVRYTAPGGGGVLFSTTDCGGGEICSATTCVGDEESSAKIIGGGEVICSAIKDDEDEKEVIYEALGVGGVVCSAIACGGGVICSAKICGGEGECSATTGGVFSLRHWGRGDMFVLI